MSDKPAQLPEVVELLSTWEECGKDPANLNHLYTLVGLLSRHVSGILIQTAAINNPSKESQD